MRIGALRHQVNILRPSSTKGYYGENVVSWSTDQTVWAEIRPLRGRLYFEAQAVQSAVTHNIRIRYTTLANTTAIGPKCRIEKVNDSRLFDIISVINPEDRNIYLDLMCKESS